MTADPQPKRKRGAPLGNLNALKHGFYSRQLRSSEIVDLQDVDAAGIQDEIAILRVIIRRLLELIQEAETLAEAVTLTRTLVTATGGLGRLVRIYNGISTGRSETDRLLNEVLTELAHEWNLDSDEFPPDPRELNLAL